MKKHHKIENITFIKDNLILFVDGNKYKLVLADISKRLAAASPEERKKYELSPSGYGIHWPLIGEDLSIDGLIGVKHKPVETKKSISA